MDSRLIKTHEVPLVSHLAGGGEDLRTGLSEILQETQEAYSSPDQSHGFKAKMFPSSSSKGRDKRIRNPLGVVTL